MNCHICMEPYNIANRLPKNLSCGHTFCDRCLRKLATGYDIECPKCRQKSKNNLPICYAIYDFLVLENKADLDEACKVHDYERLQFFCNKDGIKICALCLATSHKGHIVTSIVDKIIADENEQILSKWKDYFLFKKDEFTKRRDLLINLMKKLDSQKSNLIKEVAKDYDKLADMFNRSKQDILKELEELYEDESCSLKSIRDQVNLSIKSSESLSLLAEEYNCKMQTMSDSEILALDSKELYSIDREITETIDNLVSYKSKIKFKTVKWSDDMIFSRKEVALDELMKSESILKNHVLLFGDSKDRTILNFDLMNIKWIKMEQTFTKEFESLDYSSIAQYKSDTILITGGCVYSNYRNTASRNTYIAKIIKENQITFSEFKPLLSERFSHGLVVVRGVPYVFGGHNGNTTLNTMESFDEKEAVWKAMCNLIVEREIFSHCVVKDRYIYVFGGFNDTHLDTIEKYDTQSNKWRLLNVKMKKSLQNSTAVTLNEEQIVLIGGYNGSMHKSIDILNLVTFTWTSVEKMKVARRRSHCYKYEDKVSFM
jgi:hypothetical protein